MERGQLIAFFFLGYYQNYCKKTDKIAQKIKIPNKIMVKMCKNFLNFTDFGV